MNKKSIYWFLALALFCSRIASAQLLGPYGTSPTTFEVDANGLLSDTGSYGTGSLSISGSGTRMIWYPGKGAFRAGVVDGTYWNNSFIGAYSDAFGHDTVASSTGTFAGGTYTSATGSGAATFGYSSTASGSEAFAVGNATVASGSYALSGGNMTTASGSSSTALGSGTSATGTTSLSTGSSTTASGGNSASFNISTTASAFDATAFGTYNLSLTETGGTPSSTSWVSTDPLFEIGNGTSTTPSDALVIYKNGDTTVQGTLAAHTGMRCAPGGDLSMGSFTAGTPP